MNIQEKIKNLLERTLKVLGVPEGMVSPEISHPTEMSHGDYASNVALIISKKLGEVAKNPVKMAEKIVAEIKKDMPSYLEKVEVAGPGFINFHLSKKFFVESITEILEKKSIYGKNTKLWREKTIVEYTDPNPFKEFHIGHLMANTVGESLSRIIEFNGAEIMRACYQGDVGLHVATTIWAILNLFKERFPTDNQSIEVKVHYLGQAYAEGAIRMKEDETIKKEVQAINRKVYEKTDQEINHIYNLGRAWSLDYFDTLYEKLGTHFNFKFFESNTGIFGKEIVESHIHDGIFEKSENAIVFHGEKYDPSLHTRVFINSEGLPTYEAKELGLAKIKYDTYPYTSSIVVTGNEIDDYFKVLLKAMSLVFPDLAEKTKHISHGMLRLPTGKMSSRTGKVITAESLIDDIEKLVGEKIKDREFDDSTKKDIIHKVAIAALKYSILKQSVGKDIIFDFEKSISFEGDSGPYLQYSYVRAISILNKAQQEGIKPIPQEPTSNLNEVERLLYRFPEIVSRAESELSPQYIATYLIEVSSAFNSYYAANQIVKSNDIYSPYKVALTEAFSWVIKNGLFLLGIQVPERM